MKTEKTTFTFWMLACGHTNSVGTLSGVGILELQSMKDELIKRDVRFSYVFCPPKNIQMQESLRIVCGAKKYDDIRGRRELVELSYPEIKYEPCDYVKEVYGDGVLINGEYIANAIKNNMLTYPSDLPFTSNNVLVIGYPVMLNAILYYLVEKQNSIKIDALKTPMKSGEILKADTQLGLFECIQFDNEKVEWKGERKAG